VKSFPDARQESIMRALAVAGGLGVFAHLQPRMLV
jgi:hypothetical protein